MNFTLFSFWGLLSAGILIILLMRKVAGGRFTQRFDKLSLCLLNMTLLFSESRLTLAIFATVLVVTYLTLLWLRKVNVFGIWKHLLLGGVIFIQFLPLLYYKYGGFILADILKMPEQAGFFKGILIPTGLSFYTFQMVSFVLDYAKDHTRFPAFLDYCNFAGFFPQIVAGPIERRDDLLPQMERFAWNLSWVRLWQGLRWIVLGLFFKLSLAENIAAYSGWCYEPSDNAYLIWLGSALFGLRIYYDFAGYSLIAVGLGKMLGIRLEINFWSPYTSVDIQTFWRRWHRTLSGWFRDYVYFPLGGGRTRFWMLNILIVFVVSGIWHGAGFNFMLWGGAHGLLLILHHVFKKTISWLPKGVTWGLTMGLVILTWLFFYQTDWAVLTEKLTAIATPGNYSVAHIRDAALSLKYPTLFGIMVWGGLGALQIGLEFMGLRKGDNPYQLYRSFQVVAAMIVIIIFTAPVVQNAFIYFNF